jgi:MFS transporter, CP family, cyanate transporter
VAAGVRPGAGAPSPILTGLGVMLVAFNLRPALTTVGPLLTTIRAETGLGATGAAILTTLPVLFLGLASAAGPATIRRFGADRGILLAILIVALGLASRAVGGLGPLFFGACLSAAGIGLAGVLLPGLVKRDFPGRVGVMTGFYTSVLCLGAAAGAGLTGAAAGCSRSRLGPASGGMGRSGIRRGPGLAALRNPRSPRHVCRGEANTGQNPFLG